MENIKDDWFPSVIPIKEYDTVVDLDKPRQKPAPKPEWGIKEPDNIHELLYQQSTQGGFFKNLIYGINIGGSENVR